VIRICHIISGDLWAGAEVMIYHLLEGLQEFEDISNRVILLNEGILSARIRGLGIRVHIVDERSNSLVNILRIFKEILREEKPHIVHSHGYKVNILSYLISKSIKPVKLVATQHGMPKVPEKRFNPGYQLKSRLNLFLLSRYFHRVVGVSEEIKEAFVKLYRFPENKTWVIHNGVEIPHLMADRVNNDYFVIGSSGRLFPVKNYELMIEIARAISQKTDRVYFELAGNGPEMERLKALASEYRLGDVFSFKGHLDDISPFYRGLDVYLNTSIHEGIPMSVLEAMAHKLPVIAPRIGGLPEIIDDGVQGYLLKERDPAAYAGKCIFLYENKSLRQRMSEAAREKVEQMFSVKKMAQNYSHLYIDLAKGW